MATGKKGFRPKRAPGKKGAPPKFKGRKEGIHGRVMDPGPSVRPSRPYDPPTKPPKGKG